MRLIDADKLPEHKFTRESAKGSDYMRGWNDAIDAIIDNAPTVEPQKIVIIPPELIEKLASNVVDVVGNIDWEKAIEAYKARPQGEWIFNTTWQDYECNNCREWTRKRQGELPNFCPNCGADMRGKENDSKRA
jgi:hypothetical protein